METDHARLYLATLLDGYAAGLSGAARDLPLAALRVTVLVQRSGTRSALTCRLRHSVMRSAGAMASMSRKGDAATIAPWWTALSRPKPSSSITALRNKAGGRRDIFADIEGLFGVTPPAI